MIGLRVEVGIGPRLSRGALPDTVRPRREGKSVHRCPGLPFRPRTGVGRLAQYEPSRRHRLVPYRSLDPEAECRPAAGNLRVPPRFFAEERSPFPYGSLYAVARIPGIHGMFGDGVPERGPVPDDQGNRTFRGGARGERDPQGSPPERERKALPPRGNRFHRGAIGKGERKEGSSAGADVQGIDGFQGMVPRFEPHLQVVVRDRGVGPGASRGKA